MGKDFLKELEQFAEKLLKKNIIDHITYEKAREVYLENQIKKILNVNNEHYKSFPQILVDDFNADSDQVYHEVAKYYAFWELEIPIEEIPKSQIIWMKKTFKILESSIKNKMIKNEMMLFQTEKILRRNRYKFLVINPFNHQVVQILDEINPAESGYDVIVIKKKEFEKLLNIIRTE